MHPTARLAALLLTVVLAGCSAGTDADAGGGGAVRDYGAQNAGTTDDAADDAAVAVPGPRLQSAIDDVSRVAPALERLYRGGDYPRSLDEVGPSLAEVGEALADGNRLGAYRYDPDAVEFVLCVEHEDGAWATYDTAPMTTGRTGEGGGCPQL